MYEPSPDPAGYTFYAAEYWGKGINYSVKDLMLGCLFQFVLHVYFQIGPKNIRCQIAIGRLGAKKVGEQEVAYFGESPKLNFVYRIGKEEWQHNTNSNSTTKIYQS